MSKEELEVLEHDAGFLYGRMQNLGVIIWYQTPTTDRFQRVAQRFGEFDTADGFGVLTVVRPGCTPVGADVRDVFDRALKANRDYILGTATVIQMEGVLGGLSRAIARTMSVISRVPYPNNVFAKVSEAAQWLPDILAERRDIVIDPRDIVESIEHYIRNPTPVA